ncbi:MAG: NUDIX hydrolase [Halobacteriaceae archaeon]
MEWNVRESVTQYQTDWIDCGYDLVEQPDGTSKRYYRPKLAPAVVIVAVTETELIMVEQYRPVIGKYCLELPAGLVEQADGPVENGGGPASAEAYERAGSRELEEETGYRSENVTLMESFWVATGALRHHRGIVLATDLTPGHQDLGSDEFLEICRVPLDEARERATSPPANDATLEGILLASERGVL